MEKEVKNNPPFDATDKHEGPSRRAFLSGTGGAALAVAATGLLSGSALSQANDTPPADRASDKPSVPAKGPASKTATSSKKYPHLLLPFRIGNYVLKNRMIGTAASPHFLVGPESAPNEAIIEYYARKARAGASLIVLSQPFGDRCSTEEDVLKLRAAMPNVVNPDHGGDTGHFPTWDLANAGAQNLLSQLTEGVHFYGSLVLWKPKIETPPGYDASAGNPEEVQFGSDKLGSFGAALTGAGKAAAPPPAARKEITVEMLKETIDKIVIEATLSKECGFDGMFVHCSYRAPMTARLLSPLTNRRTDQYGGSPQNRARFVIELADAIKKRCGKDYFLMLSMSGCEPDGGYTLGEGAEYAKMFTGHIDLIDLKGDPGERDSAPTNFILERTPFLFMTEGYKKRGVKIPLVSDGGFQEFESSEAAIASGKTDFVGVARAFITTPNYGQLAYEGRNEDVVPCLRCNACHGNGFFSSWNSTCAVNPAYGLEHKIDKMISPATDKKKIAVIGGGPAGMEAALIAAQRGHSVTLYEKSSRLGGTVNAYQNFSFKWTHKDFKNYLVRQIEKSAVKVRLNTEADPAMIKRAGYDAVVVAVGAEANVPDIPGIKGKNVILATDIVGKEASLAKDVVIVGGGQTGTETGMHLAEKGHNVTVVEATNMLARDEGMRVHFYSALQNWCDKLPTFDSVLYATCNGISEDGITYVDAKGAQRSIKAGSVVIALGVKAKQDQAFQFHEAADRFYMVGDCDSAADIRRAMRTAFGTASTL